MKHFINFKNLKADEINEIIEKAIIIKNNPKKYSNSLEGKFL